MLSHEKSKVVQEFFHPQYFFHVDVHQVAIHIAIAREQLKCDCLPRRLAPWGFHPFFLMGTEWNITNKAAWFNGLVEGEIYRKARKPHKKNRKIYGL